VASDKERKGANRSGDTISRRADHERIEGQQAQMNNFNQRTLSDLQGQIERIAYALNMGLQSLSDQINYLKINEIDAKRGVVLGLRNIFLIAKRRF
jgi:hypothetical protein